MIDVTTAAAAAVVVVGEIGSEIVMRAVVVAAGGIVPLRRVKTAIDAACHVTSGWTRSEDSRAMCVGTTDRRRVVVTIADHHVIETVKLAASAFYTTVHCMTCHDTVSL